MHRRSRNLRASDPSDGVQDYPTSPSCQQRSWATPETSSAAQVIGQSSTSRSALLSSSSPNLAFPSGQSPALHSPSTSLSPSQRSVFEGSAVSLQPTAPPEAMVPALGKLPRAEKDADDPSTPPEGSNRSSFERPLSQLFKVRSQSPPVSRASAYNQGAGPIYTRSPMEPPSLTGHLYKKGLLEGRHSDITIIAFGQKYPLHRLILDRAPFFTTALSAPWAESTAKEVILHPEDIDPCITKASFELALRRLYGVDITEEEDVEAVGLFATGCWLEMHDLVASSIDAILRQMSPETLSPLIKLVTASYYGKSGEKILSSAKSMLCRDGWEMPLRYWDGIPGEIVREIIGGDGFYVESEWDRFILAKRLLDRRLRHVAMQIGLLDPLQKKSVKVPDSLRIMALRFDAVYRRNAIIAGRQTPDGYEQWVALYTHPDIEPLLVLLDEGIYYVHMDFERLQHTRRAVDVFGFPVLPEKVISNALWQQMELRQKVLNADELSLELGLSHPVEEESPRQGENSKGKQRASALTPEDEEDDEIDSGSWDGNAKPRKFWIPSTDCNIVMGGNAEPVVTTSSSFQRNASTAQSHISASLQPEDVQWATDFASSLTNMSATSRPAQAPAPTATTTPPRPVAYTHFPPFRFSAEFPNPRLLKEKKRVYSRTVFYAGSLWNIYIQKVRSARNPQLGVYLHRAKERDAEEALAGRGLGGQGQGQGGTVDERIGLLEREMILRSERRDRRRGRVGAATDAVAGEEETTSSGGDNRDPDATLVSSQGTTAPMNVPSRRGGAGRRGGVFETAERRSRRREKDKELTGTSPTLLHFPPHLVPEPAPPGWSDDSEPTGSDEESGEDEDEEDGESDARLSSMLPPSMLPPPRPWPAKGAAATLVPALPSYIDARPTIRTYFKIYSPSKGGRLLSVYESAPDRFNFSQSWGWKSGTLMLDEGFAVSTTGTGGAGGGGGGDAAGEEEEGVLTANGGLGLEGVGLGAEGRRGSKGRIVKRRGDGRLRFMVVVGNL